ncbi:OLC1v1033812C1 [Oldenlandia corymbosa var. corymbosa]|uniref:OLC1v1033812C1 n=1 Tax=Oldenlandia corymbosa var. corymbosa TaxID=529605 RepID=A0AAV1CQD5_OLDCO|nr:OLC1v1033812C1 [Oldenlandia corymbosa var. corymbosa]
MGVKSLRTLEWHFGFQILFWVLYDHQIIYLDIAVTSPHMRLSDIFMFMSLRAGLTMMKHLMDHLRDLRVHPSYAEAMRGLGGSNLSRSHVNSDFSSMSPEELWAYICPEKKKRIAEM